MRGQPKSDLEYAVDVAVARAVAAVAGPTLGANRLGAARAESGAPPGTFTTAGEDGEGNVYTKHPFILGLDVLGDPGALMTDKE